MFIKLYSIKIQLNALDKLIPHALQNPLSCQSSQKVVCDLPPSKNK